MKHFLTAAVLASGLLIAGTATAMASDLALSPKAPNNSTISVQTPVRPANLTGTYLDIVPWYAGYDGSVVN